MRVDYFLVSGIDAVAFAARIQDATGKCLILREELERGRTFYKGDERPTKELYQSWFFSTAPSPPAASRLFLQPQTSIVLRRPVATGYTFPLGELEFTLENLFPELDILEATILASSTGKSYRDFVERCQAKRLWPYAGEDRRGILRGGSLSVRRALPPPMEL